VGGVRLKLNGEFNFEMFDLCHICRRSLMNCLNSQCHTNCLHEYYVRRRLINFVRGIFRYGAYLTKQKLFIPLTV